MTSTVEIVDDENNDGFDWEEAVREIDVACQNAATSSSSIGVVSKKSSAGGKQSTLDKFLGKVGPRRTQMVEDFPDADRIDVDGDDSSGPFVSIDPEAAKSWIYPANIPVRDYQFDITKTALFSNTLVALPTGLGKTLIAAVVMYNFFRWFPEGKIVFAAPSRPLVMQQIEACHNIVGIPQEWTIDMTGQTNPAKRTDFWKTKRVFFVTPQVLERDIQSGTCLAKYLVCLVIDEAHRASGNYSYCVAVRQLMSIPVQLRILALTATPGSKQQAVQHIIDNLHISTLEYRNESDPDVSRYVHNRKVELIQVALGKDTVDVNEKLLAVIRPYVTKLSAFGLLQNRDYRTLSPPDLLNSRDKFRRAPPQVLESKRGEIEACFASLITLYHIRKLLTSHGIRPAYEMLEEKLKQGPFARLMSKNEEIWKIKLLMQRNLSRGAPSPKLSKMLEILVDHFKTMDPEKSRVIIFSNFRGSVRDIMDALASIGDIVKATEFIGQSSGKVLKGQSQKVQQAVLQKFRAGGYNVIVATSIGEEGLDIMEVDLVICFDANVSPLRMIQRMGRTGRKNDGRVVVLACEGSELKGYMRKQATGRNIRKHMHNGGISSFSFHSSPRMIPHSFKPEAQIVEMSIEQYVPRGKKAKDNDAVETPVVKQKLTAAESTLLAKYFQPATGTWRPSLIAFPHSQEFPSRVHKVMHSCRTDMLIDMMQNLHSFGSPKSFGPLSVEDEVSSGTCFDADTREKENINEQGSPGPSYSPVSMPQEKMKCFEESPLKTLAAMKQMVPNTDGHAPQSHSYFFGSDFVSVDPQGKVSILFVPSFPSKVVSHSESRGVSAALPGGSLKQNQSHSRAAGVDYRDLTMRRKDAISPGCTKDVYLAPNELSNSRMQEEEIDHEVETPSEEHHCTTKMVAEQLCLGEAFEDLRVQVPSPQVNESTSLLKDNESPRLTMLIHSGIVPESPCDNGGSLTRGNESPTHKTVSPENAQTIQLPASPGLKSNKTPVHINSCQRQISSPTDDDVKTPPTRVINPAKPGRFTVISPPSEQTKSPLANLTESNTSKDWVLSSGDKSDIGQVRKLKRLRKVGDASVPAVGSRSSFPDKILDGVKNTKGKKKPAQNICAFIEEEAEVSSEAETFDDEEDEPLNSSYDDSFIDDRVSPTAATTQGEDSRADMMAVYRRSLLTQSPLLKESSSTSVSPDSVHPVSRSPVNALNPLKSPQNDSVNQSTGFSLACSRLNPNRITAALPSTATDYPIERDTVTETKRRKLSCQTESIPVINLEQQFALQAENAVQEPSQTSAAGECTADVDMLCDDQFFASIDFDAVEAQATSLLKLKQESLLGKKDLASNSNIQQNVNLHTSPSFDLGI